MTKEDSVLNNEDIKVYEIGYLLVPTVAESDVATEASKIRAIVEEKGGVFLSDGMPQMRNLTYTISGKSQKFNSAYFGWLKFEADGAKAVDIKDEVKKLENILRFLIIKTVKENYVTMTKVAKFSFENEDTAPSAEVAEDAVVEEDKELDETIEELVIE